MSRPINYSMDPNAKEKMKAHDDFIAEENRKAREAVAARIVLLHCPACGIKTNHEVLKNGNVVCWCGCEHADPRKQWTAEMILRREG